MVKAINVFKYDYTPTKAEIRVKIGTKKTIKRSLSNLYKDNNIKNLDHLKTVIRGLDESIEYGTLGYIDHQYFRKLETGGGNYTYEDNWEEYFFFISSKFKILIIGGGQEKRRLKARDILVEYLSGDISFISPIIINTNTMFSLVNTIKRHGPKDEGEYKNIMTDAVWKFPRKDMHDGAKREETNMHRDPNDPRCISKYHTFEQNLRDSVAFDTIMWIYRCNGILEQESSVGNYLEMYEQSRFVSTSDPTPVHWIIFVTQTCKNALGIV